MTYNGCLPYTSTERHKHNLDWGKASKPWAFSAWLTFCSQRNNIFPCKSLSPLFAVGILLIYKWWQEVFTQIIQVQKSIYEVGISVSWKCVPGKRENLCRYELHTCTAERHLLPVLPPICSSPKESFFHCFQCLWKQKNLKKKDEWLLCEISFQGTNCKLQWLLILVSQV